MLDNSASSAEAYSPFDPRANEAPGNGAIASTNVTIARPDIAWQPDLSAITDPETRTNMARIGGAMLRIFVSPTRSGSTALLRCFECNPAVDQVYHQPVKSGYRQDGTFDYSFFQLGSNGNRRVLVAKETVGGFAEPETTFSPFPNAGRHEQIGPWLASPAEIDRLEPLVLMRDPTHTWASIERLNRYSSGISPYYSPFEFFVSSYRRVGEFLVAARDRILPVHCVTQEMLGSEPDTYLPQICEKWGIPWADSMIYWDRPYGVKTWFSEEAIVRMDTDPRFKHSKESLQSSTQYGYKPSSTEGYVEDWQASIIEQELLPLYQAAVSFARQDFGRLHT